MTLATEAVPAAPGCHVLLLIALAGLSYADVAAALGIAEGTVGSRLNRARRIIRAALGGADPTRHDPSPT